LGWAIKIALFVAAVVACVIVFSILFFYRPIATTFWLRRSALRRGGFRKTTFRTTAGKQTVWSGGSGPVVVLLHGAGDQAGTWFKVAPELSTNFRS
jgi:pimeloyl-ACP methyl ester carboxylesterase